MTRGQPALGLIETMRVLEGRIPWLDRHLARLTASMSALDLTPPPARLKDMLLDAGRDGDYVLRVELHDGDAEITTRELTPPVPPAIVVAEEVHAAYPHKTTARAQFGRAFSSARRIGADDALLFTQAGHAAEGTSWNLFWWDRGTLCTPPRDMGILPGIGRSRVMELAQVREVRAHAEALAGWSLFLVNAVRGIVEIGTLGQREVPRDPRTAELSAAFWSD